MVFDEGYGWVNDLQGVLGASEPGMLLFFFLFSLSLANGYTPVAGLTLSFRLGMLASG